MRDFDISEMAEMVSPYFATIREAQQKSFLGTLSVKDMFIEKGIPITLKPESKGSIISDLIKTHLDIALSKDINARVVEINDFPALLINEQILVRFNKMDDKFQAAIQKRIGYQKFMNQGEVIEGFSPDIIRIWAGFIPIDKQWSGVARYFLVCFDAGKVVWFNDLDNNYSVEQLSIDITPTKPRRTKPKTQTGEGEQETKTGTDNK